MTIRYVPDSAQPDERDPCCLRFESVCNLCRDIGTFDVVWITSERDVGERSHWAFGPCWR
jgi:hypothetical protein